VQTAALVIIVAALVEVAAGILISGH
jgi:hypothetical protein